MNFQLVSTKLNSSSWAHPAIERYLKKISHYHSMESHWVKVAKVERKNRLAHKKISNEKIEKALNSRAIKISFDENGQKMSSPKFAQCLSRHLDSGKKEFQFFIGGPYGLSENILSQSSEVVSLSNLVFCQEVAIIVALEQIYRALTIINNIPYHND